jgi:hypothetical protein
MDKERTFKLAADCEKSPQEWPDGSSTPSQNRPAGQGGSQIQSAATGSPFSPSSDPKDGDLQQHSIR